MNGNNPIGQNTSPQSATPLVQNAARGASARRVIFSNRLPRSLGGNQIPQQGDRLRPVVHVLNAPFRNHVFTEEGFVAYLTNQAVIDPLFDTLGVSTVEQIGANSRHFVRAMFPTDQATRGSFVLSPRSINALRASPIVAQRQRNNLTQILPFMGLRWVNQSLSVMEDFDFAADAPWLLTRKGRAQIATVIRSLHISGNISLARQLRDAMLAIARRANLEPRQSVVIACALEDNYGQVIAQDWRAPQTNQSAQTLLDAIDFTHSQPMRGLAPLSDVQSRYIVPTADYYADFLLGHSFDAQGNSIRQIVATTDFDDTAPDSAIFRQLFPNHQLELRQADEPLVTLDSHNVFANNYLARQSQRILAHHALARFGISFEGSQAALMPNFERRRWTWLDTTGQAQQERALLTRIIQSLHLLSSERLALSIQNVTTARLNIEEITDPELNADLTPLAPCRLPIAAPASVEPPAPSVSPPQLPTQIEPRNIPPTEPLPFAGSPAQQYQAYINSRLREDHSLSYLYPSAPGKEAVIAIIFPTDEPEPSNLHLPLLSQEIQALIIQDPQISHAQINAINSLFSRLGIGRTNEGVYYRRSTFPRILANSVFFNSSPNNTAPRIITRLIRHFALTGRLDEARQLQDLFLSEGLNGNIDSQLLVQWHFATAPNYHQMMARIDATQVDSVQAAANLKQLMQSVREGSYQQRHLATLLQHFAAIHQQNAPDLSEQPQVIMSWLSPSMGFNLQGTRSQQFRAYLGSELYQRHIKEYVRPRREGWIGAIGAAFPIDVPWHQDINTPIIDTEIPAFFLPVQFGRPTATAQQAQDAQFQLLEALLGECQVRIENGYFFPAENFNVDNNPLFASDGELLKVLARVIHHFYLTHRTHLAQRLKCFLLSHAVGQDISRRALLHLHFAGDHNYHSNMHGLDFSLITKPESQQRRSAALAEIESLDYLNLQRLIEDERLALQIPSMPAVNALSAPLPFTGSNAERFQAYMNSELYRQRFDAYLRRPDVHGWHAVLASIFPLPTPSRINTNFPVLDDELISLLSCPNSIRLSQSHARQALLSHLKVKHLNSELLVAEKGFKPEESALFYEGPDALFPRAMTRLIRHYAMTNRIAIAKSLQRFLITEGLHQATSATLAHWHLATEPDYQTRRALFDLRQVTQSQANEYLDQIMAAIYQANYPQQQRDTHNQARASNGEPLLPKTVLTEQKYVAVTEPFPFFGNNTERFAAYMNSRLKLSHEENYILRPAENIETAVAALFPLETLEPSNPNLPVLDAGLISFLQSEEASEIRSRQEAVIHSIIATLRFRKIKSIYHRVQHFDSEQTVRQLFSTDPNVAMPRIMARIIHHLAMTNRLEHARSLQAFLISEGIHLKVDTKILAQWHYATEPDFTTRMANIDSAQLNQELAQRDYAAYHLGLLEQLYATHYGRPRPDLSMPVQPRPSRLPPNADFGFVGTPLQRFRAYMTSNLFAEHGQLIKERQQGWMTVVAAAFPIRAAYPENLSLPTLNDEITDFFEVIQFGRPLGQAAQIAQAQNRLLTAIMAKYHIRRVGQAYEATPEFDPQTSELFNDGEQALLMARIIHHLHVTNRDELAEALATFLLSSAPQSNLAPVYQAHWHLALYRNYEEVAGELATAPAKRLKDIMRDIRLSKYASKQAEIIQQQRALRPEPPPRQIGAPVFQAQRPAAQSRTQPRFDAPEPPNRQNDQSGD